jgi:excinuclease ABC subunit A
VHNLRGVDVDLPRDALVVFTGVSGSGKSSLAFGTVYAEAQRRYLETVAPFARRLIDQVGAPRVDAVTGLPPAVALQQRRGTPGSRSTVGTLSTLSSTMRMLYSRAGTYPAGTTERLDSDAFSPNTPAGACPECHGLGRVHVATEQSMVPDPSLTIRERAIAAWPGAWMGKSLRDMLDALGYDIDRPWRELPQEQRDWILFTDEQPVVTVHPVREAHRVQRTYEGTYVGARRYVMRTLAESRSATMRRRMLGFVDTSTCPRCHGGRLREESLAVTFAGLHIARAGALPLVELGELLRPTAGRADAVTARPTFDSGEETDVAVTLARELLAVVDLLVELGLGYLSLDRLTPTLSGGELQRLRMATALRTGLFGVLYVLDEPAAGLHPADAEPLLRLLDQLRRDGSTLFVVEHDLDVVRRADWVVDVGPGAGQEGGRVLYSGPVAGLAEVAESATGRHLFAPPRTQERPPRDPAGWLRLRGATRHNLVGLDVDLPLGVLTAVTGVSGSGKSTLVSQVLADVVAEHLGRPVEDEDELDPLDVDLDEEPTTGVQVEGLEQLDRLVQVDQRPIGRTPRSNLATYTGLFDAVRRAFAATPEARERGYGVGRFSFNVAGGRCETCQGEGYVAVELLFLPGSYGPCPTCRGARYNPETLEVTYRGLSIADVLDLTVTDAAAFFADLPAVHRSLDTLQRIGLGYLHLGQPATELSGGEAQRIKLATELQRTRRGATLYLLDEPTTGLHPADVLLLMTQLHGLVDGGSTVVVVEHDLSVVATADHVIDLGPGAGSAGGRVVAAGTPAAVARVAGSRTAEHLAAHLSGPGRR